MLPCFFAQRGSPRLKALPFLVTQCFSFQTQSTLMSSQKDVPRSDHSFLHPETMVTGVTGTHPMITQSIIIIISVISLAPTHSILDISPHLLSETINVPKAAASMWPSLELMQWMGYKVVVSLQATGFKPQPQHCLGWEMSQGELLHFSEPHLKVE